MAQGRQVADAVRAISAEAVRSDPAARADQCLLAQEALARPRAEVPSPHRGRDRQVRALLLTILPGQVIGRLNQGEAVIADHFEGVSVPFADLVSFTEHSARVTPAAMVEYLNRLFSEFDALAREHGVEKIKTIGDAYMAVAGLPDPNPDPFAVIARMALGMIDRLGHVNGHFGWPLQIRIGIHSGPVVAGIIGTHRFIYDVWGDTVNVASRLEDYSLPNRIHVSQDTARHLVGSFALEPRGSIDVKGKGKLETFFLSRI
ncbi:class 3 adenylate cyclase [Afipia massiliensis]|uniref:Class 3 adenylate cyclase n=1 Tax=Afipia massiliensis TaxID=211460 RepID=A0A840NA52_9BRAD|nr:class 3 adenylate cyclase [Afipia massiliensis]